nr:DNA internalization-related competence protein ComEC/Rec2 [Metabacillus iocasae]
MALSFILSIYAYEYRNEVTVILCFVYIAFLYVRCSKKVFMYCIGASVLFTFYYSELDKRNVTALSDNQTEFHGIIASSPSINGDRLSFQFSTLNEKVIATYTLSTEREKQRIADLEMGMNCFVTGKLVVPERARNERAFDYHQYLHHKKIHWMLQVNRIDDAACQKKSIGFMHRLLSFRQQGIQYIDATFDETVSPFMQALIYGERKEMDNNVLKAYQQLGVIHLLAISGLHVGLLIGVCFYLLIRIGLTRERTITIIMCVLPIYTLFAGAAPSVIRASFMTMLVLLSLKLKDRLIPIDALSMACMLMLLINPYYVFQVGFQLSFTVSFSLILCSHSIIQKQKTFLRQLFIVSTIAQLGSLPLILYHFYEISLISLPLNMLFVPLYSILILPLCFLTLFSTLLLPFVGEIFESILSLLIAMSVECTSLLSSISVLQLTLGALSVYMLLSLYGTIIYLFYKMEQSLQIKPLVGAIGTIMLLICMQSFIGHFNPYGKVTMIDVGQGDSILIELPFRKAVYLIDTGGMVPFEKEAWQEKKTPFEVGEDVVVPYLKSRGIRRINKLIITHGDYDHAGGALALLDHLFVDEIMVGKKEKIEGVEKEIITEAIKHNIHVNVVQTGDEWTVEDNVFYVIAPHGEESSKNDGSVVLLTKLGGYTWLFTGDLEEEGERKMMKMFPNIEVDILKVGHHGSKTSTTKEFVQYLNPKVALISVGKANRYNHPHPDVLHTLNEYQTMVFRTDEDGMVTYLFSKNDGTFTTTIP